MPNKSSTQEWDHVLQTLATIEVKPDWQAVATSTGFSHPQNASVSPLLCCTYVNLSSPSRRKFRDICKNHGYLYDGKSGTLKKIAVKPATEASAVGATSDQEESAGAREDSESSNKKRKVEETVGAS